MSAYEQRPDDFFRRYEHLDPVEPTRRGPANDLIDRRHRGTRNRHTHVRPDTHQLLDGRIRRDGVGKDVDQVLSRSWTGPWYPDCRRL